MRKTLRLSVVTALIASLLVAVSGCGYATQASAADLNPYPNQKVHPMQISPYGGDVTKITHFYQSPMLDSMKLPPVRKRLPDVPKLVNEMPESELHYTIGRYGGTLHTVTSSVGWDADVFVMDNEPLLNTPGILGQKITGNILQGYKASNNNKTFTFYLRKGLKWSDGYPVTMKDFEFTVNDVIFNKQLTPSIPTYMRTGDSPTGKPMTFKVLNPWAFQISFAKPYPGFLMQLAVIGWNGYTDLLKPFHYLKKYHIKYASKKQLQAEEKAVGVTDWVNLFHKMDVTNWQLTTPQAKGFPVLYPWMVTKATNTYTDYVRNPYYFKVDAAGNQLPYIDKIHSTYVQNMEMVNLDMLSGQVDFGRQSAALPKMAMYKLASKNTDMTAITSGMHLVPTTFFLNLNYNNKTWREVANNIKFREALNLAIPRKEIIDSVYYGLAKPSDFTNAPFDLKKANELLNEMGMKKGPDGYRRAPDGSKFAFTFQIDQDSPDFVPVTQIIVNEWKALGLDVTMKVIDSALWGQRNAANELEASMMWIADNRWYAGDWGQGMWDPLWNEWITSNGKQGEKPPASVQNLYRLIAELYQVPASEARTKIYQEIKNNVNKNLWFFSPIMDVQQPVVLNKDLGNVTDKGYAIALNFSAEELYYKATK